MLLGTFSSTFQFVNNSVSNIFYLPDKKLPNDDQVSVIKEILSLKFMLENLCWAV